MDRSKHLGEGSIIKLLLKFSIPAIVGMIVNALYNVVDRIFVGQGVGPLAIAGITIGFPIFLVIMAFGMLVGIGANSLISIRLGEQQKDQAEKIFGNAIVLLIVSALVITVVGLIFLDPLLRLFGASEAVLPYARDYTFIILLGTIFQSISFGMNNFIRGEGNPKVAMYTMLIGAIINMILDPIFIFVFNMGIRGAAYATVLSQLISSIWVLYYFLRGPSLLKIHVKNLKLKLSVIRNIFAIGSAPFAMQISASLLTILLNNSLKIYGGDLAISAMGIINSISLFILMPIFGINQGSQPIIGYNYGARKYDRVKNTLKMANTGATGIVIIGFIIIRVMPDALIGLFNNDDQMLLDIGVHGLQVFMLMLPIIGFQIVSSNYFQAVGKPKHAMLLSLSRQVLLLIPALLILPRFFGLEGVWMAGPVADLGSSILTGIFLAREINNLDIKYNGKPAMQE